MNVFIFEKQSKWGFDHLKNMHRADLALMIVGFNLYKVVKSKNPAQLEKVYYLNLPQEK